MANKDEKENTQKPKVERKLRKKNQSEKGCRDNVTDKSKRIGSK